MSRYSKLGLASPFAIAFVLALAGPASAGVMTPVSKAAIAPNAPVESVHWRWHRHWAHGCHHHYRYSYYVPGYRYSYYAPGYDYGYYTGYGYPAGAVVGAAETVATAPLWPLGWFF